MLCEKRTIGTLGKYLYLCGVKVIDSDYFPSNEFEDLIIQGRFTAPFEANNIEFHLLDYLCVQFKSNIVFSTQYFSWYFDT